MDGLGDGVPVHSLALDGVEDQKVERPLHQVLAFSQCGNRPYDDLWDVCPGR